MASISGNLASAAIKRAGTWGTAVAVGSGNRLRAKITDTQEVQKLVADTIGSGRIMAADGTIGNTIPRVSLEMQPGYRNNFDVLLALFLGTSASPGTEITASQGDYLHKPQVNTTLDAGGYATLAWETSTTTVKELVTAAVTSFGISFPSIPGFPVATFELLGDQIKYSSTENDNSEIQAATFTEGNPELITCAFVDTFWVDDQSTGALASGDLYSIVGYDLSLDRPHEIRAEIKGSAGNSAPVSGGDMTGTVTVDIKTLADHTWYTVWAAETAKKSRLSMEGSAIGTGVNKRFTILLPRMKLLDAPNAPLTSPGYIPLTLTFDLFDAVTAPTGMDSAFPHFEIVNTLSTSLVA
jgi:hypothetical protein